MSPAPPVAPALISVSAEISESRGWILYDSRCPLCARGARRLGGIACRRGYRLAPLGRRWVRERLPDPPDEMLLLLPDGRVLGGADAYIHLSWRVWWATPLALLASLPGLRFLTRRLYARIARNRPRISRACGLEKACRAGA
jgi:predicted DCC family thiol-disulfide oxidoreductase YuxK